MSPRVLRSVAVLSVVALAGCGVPTNRKAENIPKDQIPFDLLAPSTTQPATTLPVATTQQTVYMLKGDKLAPVVRVIAAPASTGSVIASLIQGPTDAEHSSGFRTLINTDATLLSAQVVDGVASLNLNDAFAGLTLSDQILALAQLTFTATENPAVTGVRISINSAAVDLPRADGSTTKEPLRRSDYEALRPANG